MKTCNQISFKYVKAYSRKVRKANFEERVITHEKVSQPWRKSNLMCNTSYGGLLLSFMQIRESTAKKSPENLCDRQTEWQTDRVQTYSLLRFHRLGTNNMIRCEKCPRKFPDNLQLREHMKIRHEESLICSHCSKSLICSHCSRKFSSKSGLCYH